MLHNVYISLGSNKGDKLQFLQQAINAIHEQLGSISSISPIYKTAAWGFDSDDFYNCCAHLTCSISPENVLNILLKIEKQLGRTRNNEDGYSARTIDLDIIFYDDNMTSSEILTVPHPSLQNRLFVLKPLCDIAPDFIHPVLKENITTLLAKCKDDSAIERTSATLKNPFSKHLFSKYNFVAIEGNIGSGKTSLSTKIASDFNAKLILERFAENAFLPKFYEDPQRFAFPLEMSFLADRYQQLSDDIAQFDLFKEFVVSDYHISKSLTFAKVTLSDDEFKLYRKFFNVIYKDMQQPDLYIYLYQNTQRLLENIKKRGRDYEQKIQPDYLEKLNRGYVEFMKSQPNLQVKVIDVSELDFVNRREDYLKVLSEIEYIIWK